MAADVERLAFLEGRVVEHAGQIDGIREAIGAMDDKMARQFAAMDDRMSRQFTWLVGIQITTLIAIVAALLAQ